MIQRSFMPKSIDPSIASIRRISRKGERLMKYKMKHSKVRKPVKKARRAK